MVVESYLVETVPFTRESVTNLTMSNSAEAKS
jgi:hypothetical protein